MSGVDLIDTEDFIVDMRARPALWDANCENYSNKVVKLRDWEEVSKKFVPDYGEKDADEKNRIGTDVRRKWKSLRASYTRELLLKRKEKDKSRASGRKQYVYFDQLRFLEATCRSVADSQEEEQERAEEEEEERPEKKRQRGKTVREERGRPSAVTKGPTKCRDPAAEGGDVDAMFMLSLVPELKKVPEFARLKVKADLMNVLLTAQEYYNISTHSGEVTYCKQTLTDGEDD